MQTVVARVAQRAVQTALEALKWVVMPKSGDEAGSVNSKKGRDARAGRLEPMPTSFALQNKAPAGLVRVGQVGEGHRYALLFKVRVAGRARITNSQLAPAFHGDESRQVCHRLIAMRDAKARYSVDAAPDTDRTGYCHPLEAIVDEVAANGMHDRHARKHTGTNSERKPLEVVWTSDEAPKQLCTVAGTPRLRAR